VKPTDPLVVLDVRTNRAVIRALLFSAYPALTGETERGRRIRKGRARAADFMLRRFGSTSFDGSSVRFPP